MEIDREPDLVLANNDGEDVWVFYFEEMRQYNLECSRWFDIRVNGNVFEYILKGEWKEYKGCSRNIASQLRIGYQEWLTKSIEQELLS